MPVYEFICKNCKHEFSQTMRLGEYDKVKVVCPKCKSNKVEQEVAAFYTVTSKKS
jgi:putative FmdB family regulatory protein